MFIQADQAAQHLLSLFWDKRLPVDPEHIARRVGVRVQEEFGLDEGLSGKFEYVNNQPTIFVNMAETPLRQRFTVAHELGHYALKHGRAFRDPAAHFSRLTYDPRETAANRFAAELLMPAVAVNTLIQKHGATDLTKLANTFKVSEQAMMFRLKNLGWL